MMIGNMGDVAALTDRLALMPDQMLPRLAQQYKGDAITLSLILGEKQRRDHVRNSVKTQAAAQQPKVNDQIVASMQPQQLPEDVGIGTLSAPNIARMADGGIAGYADGDLIAQNEPVVRMSGGGVVAFNGSGANLVSSFTDWLGKMGTTLQEYAASPVETQASLRDMYKSMMGASEAAPAAAAEAAPVAETAAKAGTEAAAATAEKGGIRGLLGKAMPWLGRAAGWGQVALHSGDLNANEADQLGKRDIYSAMYGMKNAPAPIKAALSDPDISKTDFIKRLNAWYARNPESASATAIKDAATTTAGSDKEKAPVVKPPVMRPPVATPPAAPAPRTLTAEQAKAQAKQFADYGPAKEELQKATDDAETSAAKMRAALTAGLPQTPALQGLEKLLDKQESETGGEKEKAAGLALLSAGLAIAGGSSRYALQNLKEAIPAVAQYGDALKDIKKMERENMKMRGEIEQARRAEARDDTKLKLQLEEKIADRRDKINELGIGLTSKIADTDARTATTLWTTSQEMASRERTAGVTANAQLNMFRQLGAAPEGSALQKGFQMYKQESAEPTLYANYIKMANDPMQGEAFLKKYPTFDVYKAGMTGQGQFYSDSTVNPNAVRGR